MQDEHRQKTSNQASRRFALFAIFWAFWALLLGQQVYAQQNPQQSPLPQTQQGEPQNPLKRGFAQIELGQSVAEFRRQLAKGSTTYFRDSTSEIEEGSRESLIAVQGSGLVTKGLFQFAARNAATETSAGESEPAKSPAELRLAVITIFLQPQFSSYQQIFSKLVQNYGKPDQLTPQHSVWQDTQTILTLERDLRYKIIDLSYLEDQLQQREQQQSGRYQYRYEEFLKQF